MSRDVENGLKGNINTYISDISKDIEKSLLAQIDHIKDRQEKFFREKTSGYDGGLPENFVKHPDYALYSLGARPIASECSPSYSILEDKISTFLGLGKVGQPPSVALMPGTVPGNCWSFRGSRGNFSIELSRHVRPASFSIDHPSRYETADRTSAPKKIQLWASEACISGAYRLLPTFLQPLISWDVFLGEHTYSLDGPSVQTFDITFPDHFQGKQAAYPSYQLRILENWGKAEYTCLYRFRLHSSDMTNHDI